MNQAFGALPVTLTLDILAALLALSALLALVLLRTIRAQQRQLRAQQQQWQHHTQQVSDARASAQRARATEQTLREAAHRLPLIVFVAHRDRERHYRLDFLAGDPHPMFGLDRRSLVSGDDRLPSWPFQDRIHPDDQPRLRHHLQQALLRGQAATLELRAYGGDGLRWLRLATVATRRAGEGTRLVGYFIDTTQAHAHQQSLRAARDAAERASKAKTEFLATMSHEIRTPMNGVLGMLELLGQTPLNAEQGELLHAVEDSAGVLLQVLNDILDFSKLEAGNLRLALAPFEPRILIDNVASLVAGNLHRKGLDVEIAMDANVAGQWLGDSVRIRQILLNLLNNAGKFTEHGRIALHLRVLGDDGRHQHLRLSVIDTGIGIAEDKQATLFTPFAQAEDWTARRYGGTGLGLAICRYLVQLMDGEIHLHSAAGRGTRVSVDLRLPVAQRPVQRPPGLVGKRAVVRLQASATRDTLCAYLDTLGLDVEILPPTRPLRNGIAADLLFVDPGDRDSPLQIPAHAIAVDDSLEAPNMPVVADDRIVLGANPLRWQALVRACQGPDALAAGAASTPVATVQSTSAAAPSMGETRPRILVAEDHPVNQRLIRRQLQQLGWPCEVVDDGHAAYSALCGTPYALLLSDCQMPAMDGYALAAAWRRHETEHGLERRLPIIAMTAHTLDANEIDRCRRAGMDDCLGKPVLLAPLEAKLRKWLPDPPPAAQTAPLETGLDEDSLHVLLTVSRADIDALDQAGREGDAAAAVRHLHHLLGGLQIFVDTPLLADSRRLLDDLDSARADSALRALPAHLIQLRDLLGQLQRDGIPASPESPPILS